MVRKQVCFQDRKKENCSTRVIRIVRSFLTTRNILKGRSQTELRGAIESSLASLDKVGAGKGKRDRQDTGAF